jgi:cytochrome c nitrite reductase small subunit
VYRVIRSLQAILVGLTLGSALGVGGFTFIYARGASYLTNDPEACANCHVMRGHFDAWIKSSHGKVAVCNDCHTPPGLIPKYVTKASNGFWHSFAFTTGQFTDEIRIKPQNLDVAEQACRKCHQPIVAAIDTTGRRPHEGDAQVRCIRCHMNVGHLE